MALDGFLRELWIFLKGHPAHRVGKQDGQAADAPRHPALVPQNLQAVLVEEDKALPAAM